MLSQLLLIVLIAVLGGKRYNLWFTALPGHKYFMQQAIAPCCMSVLLESSGFPSTVTTYCHKSCFHSYFPQPLLMASSWNYCKCEYSSGGGTKIKFQFTLGEGMEQIGKHQLLKHDLVISLAKYQKGLRVCIKQQFCHICSSDQPILGTVRPGQYGKKSYHDHSFHIDRYRYISRYKSNHYFCQA